MRECKNSLFLCHLELNKGLGSDATPTEAQKQNQKQKNKRLIHN